jgi:DNA-binding response OmpR family regulator
VFIGKLRMKLANASQRKSYTETVWALGYAFAPPNDDEARIPV